MRDRFCGSPSVFEVPFMLASSDMPGTGAGGEEILLFGVCVTAMG
jgi:hypothetical protein